MTIERTAASRQPLPAEVITPDLVHQTLRAIRSSGRLDSSPLINLEVLGRRLAADGLADTCEAQAALLPRWLEEVAWGELSRLRDQATPAALPQQTAERLLALVAADLQAHHLDREVWGILHFRHFSGSSLTVRQLAHHVGVSEKTLRRRLEQGYRSLADKLREQEIAARRQAGTIPAQPSSMAYDRLVFVEQNGPRELQAALGELLGVVRGNGAPMVLTVEDACGMARFPVEELADYRLGRVAEWSQPRYRLDERFVSLSLLVDLGEESPAGRWKVQERRFTALGEALAAVAEPAVVLLGPPGSGKSTLLRRLELELAWAALGRDGHGGRHPVSFLVSLNQYAAAPGEPLLAPEAWLERQWGSQHPKLPPLAKLLSEAQVVLLLDGLNEVPHANADAYRQRIGEWKGFLHQWITPESGHRAIIACRSLDYSAPLSTPRLRVPQVRLEPMSDAQVREFLVRYAPGEAEALWAELAGTALLDAVRWPYFLRLLVEDIQPTGVVPQGLAALFTGFVRRALTREVLADNPRFAPSRLLSDRDYERVVSQRGWRTPYELPSGGALFPSLAHLAHGMQAEAVNGESSQARIRYDGAIALLGGDEAAREVVRAGVDLAVLDVDQAADEVQFGHQLVQEYFAGRRLAERPEPERVASPWRVADFSPTIDELLAVLAPGEALPSLPTTGWEESTLLAAEMAPAPDDFIEGLMATNLVLAGRAANLPSVRPHVGTACIDRLRWALVDRSRDPEADLRARIAAGLTLGDLGDPRFERRQGPLGEYLMPPLVQVPAGTYPIGDDDPLLVRPMGQNQQREKEAHMPRHKVPLASFAIGRFPVTNAEWACFMAAGGYEDDRWWDTADGRRWRQGLLPDLGQKLNNRQWRKEFQLHPDLIDQLHDQGQWESEAEEARWRAYMAIDDAQFEAALDEHFRPTRRTEPNYWREPQLNNPSQPVAGVCWYEARAYCAWLGEQSGLKVRLPTEVEWEAAARGPEGRLFPWADTFDLAHDHLRVNMRGTRLKRSSPVGVFPGGDSPFGATDMGGNAYEWTSSLITKLVDGQMVACAYPYDAMDGREDASAPQEARRVMRGGGCWNGPNGARGAARDDNLPDARAATFGFRVAVE